MKTVLSHVPILFSLDRDRYAEILVHGVIALIQSDGGMIGNVPLDVKLPLRSCLKPWQLLASIGEPSEPSDLMACASHSGQPIHLDALYQLAARLGVDPESILCPSAYPMDSQESTRLQGAGAAKRRLYHPCSGKHLAYAFAHRRGGESDDYRKLVSPVHRQLEIEVREGGVQNPVWVPDSCGLPCLVAPISDILLLWNNLTSTVAGQKLIECWRSNPTLIGGNGRLDTWISEQTGGALIAKEGADGLLVVRDAQPGQSSVVFIKLTNGHNSFHLAAGLLLALNRHSEKLGDIWRTLNSALRQKVAGQIPGDQLLVVRN